MSRGRISEEAEHEVGSPEKGINLGTRRESQKFKREAARRKEHQPQGTYKNRAGTRSDNMWMTHLCGRYPRPGSVAREPVLSSKHNQLDFDWVLIDISYRMRGTGTRAVAMLAR